MQTFSSISMLHYVPASEITIFKKLGTRIPYFLSLNKKTALSVRVSDLNPPLSCTSVTQLNSHVLFDNFSSLLSSNISYKNKRY